MPRFHPRPGALARASLAVLAALLLLAGTAGPAPVVVQAQAQADDESIVGAFTVSIGRNDLPPNLPGRAVLLGLWTISFAADGTYEVARQDVGRVGGGAYSVDGDTLTFDDWQGLVGCGGPTAADPPGTYTWSRSGDTLELTVIEDPCADRRLLLTTRAFGSFQACTVAPLPGFGRGAEPPTAAEATPVAVPASQGVGAQEGLPEGADAQAAIDALLRQATGCWATGDPGRFLALHTTEALAELAAFGPLPEFATQLRLFMTTPLEFRRIGDVALDGPDRAWAYVEITLGGEALPQRLDFAFEDGAWLFDGFFLLGPTTPDPAAPAETP
jgi:hypothetical protein